MSEKPGARISLLLSKSTKEVDRFNILVRRLNHCQYYFAFTTNALLRDLGFNPDIFWSRIW
jgi:hypothetical protein